MSRNNRYFSNTPNLYGNLPTYLIRRLILYPAFTYKYLYFSLSILNDLTQGYSIDLTPWPLNKNISLLAAGDPQPLCPLLRQTPLLLRRLRPLKVRRPQEGLGAGTGEHGEEGKRISGVSVQGENSKKLQGHCV